MGCAQDTAKAHSRGLRDARDSYNDVCLLSAKAIAAACSVRCLAKGVPYEV